MNHLSVETLTDEQILTEFVKRFKCDGAVLIYLDEKSEFGFGAWNNSIGKTWVNYLFKLVKKETELRITSSVHTVGVSKYRPQITK